MEPVGFVRALCLCFVTFTHLMNSRLFSITGNVERHISSWWITGTNPRPCLSNDGVHVLRHLGHVWIHHRAASRHDLDQHLLLPALGAAGSTVDEEKDHRWFMKASFISFHWSIFTIPLECAIIFWKVMKFFSLFRILKSSGISCVCAMNLIHQRSCHELYSAVVQLVRYFFMFGACIN